MLLAGCVGPMIALEGGTPATGTPVSSKVQPQAETTVLPEIRGLWVTRWNFKTADDVRRIVREAHEAGFNALFWQVRGNGDAFYRSRLEPWGAELSGKLGKDPGFDPLRIVLDEAHARGMQVHAWMNAYPMWRGKTAPPQSQAGPTVPLQIYLAHPEWRAMDDKGKVIDLNDHYVFASPGIPAVKKYIAAVARDIVKRYDVDGIHLDYIRYGGRQYSHDPVSLKRFAAANRSAPTKGLREIGDHRRQSWEDWQREQVNETVRGVYRGVKSAFASLRRDERARRGTRPLLSAAVWGIYRDQWGWRASQGYSDYYQDPREWVRGGYVDFVCPMIYWPIKTPRGGRLDWATLTVDHIAGCGGNRVVAGIHANYENFEEIAAEIELARKHGARGVALFAYPYLAEKKYFDNLATGPFREE